MLLLYTDVNLRVARFNLILIEKVSNCLRMLLLGTFRNFYKALLKTEFYTLMFSRARFCLSTRMVQAATL